jgi:hypothetical protein
MSATSRTQSARRPGGRVASGGVRDAGAVAEWNSKKWSVADLATRMHWGQRVLGWREEEGSGEGSLLLIDDTTRWW